MYTVRDNGRSIVPKEAVFTTKLKTELRAEFTAEAAAAHRPAFQVMRELMRKFVQRQREAREYEGFYATKSTLPDALCVPFRDGRMKRLKPNFPHGVRMQRTRREDYLDAGGRARP